MACHYHHCYVFPWNCSSAPQSLCLKLFHVPSPELEDQDKEQTVSAQLRHSMAPMKELTVWQTVDRVCLWKRAATDLSKVFYEVFFTNNSRCSGAEVPPSEQGWNPAAGLRSETRDTHLSFFSLASVRASCLQGHCPFVKLEWKWADGLGRGNDLQKPCIRKIKFKIDGLKAKILLCTHFFPRAEEESAEMWQVPVTLLHVFLEAD